MISYSLFAFGFTLSTIKTRFYKMGYIDQTYNIYLYLYYLQSPILCCCYPDQHKLHQPPCLENRVQGYTHILVWFTKKQWEFWLRITALLATASNLMYSTSKFTIWSLFFLIHQKLIPFLCGWEILIWTGGASFHLTDNSLFRWNTILVTVLVKNNMQVFTSNCT